MSRFRHRRRTRSLTATALAAVVALATGCGSDNALRGEEPPPVPGDLACLDGALSGAGSSAQENAMHTWVAAYQIACSDALVLYDAIGSGGGRSQFIDGAVDFAGSDSALEPEEHQDARERCSGAPAVNLPGYVVPIAVVFHLEGVDSLNLRPAVLAKIFDGRITRWNDPEIAEDNPGTDLPDTRITPVTRSDESGTTENFTSYLAAAAGDAWPHEPSGNWPRPPVEAAQGNSGIAEAVESAQGAIGYVEASHIGSMSTAAIGHGDGEFVGVDPEAAARVVAASPEREGGGEHDHALEIDYGTTEPGTYPIVLVTYEIACLRYPTPEEAERVRAFLGYVFSEAGQRAAAQETGSAPLPEGLRADLLDAVAAIGAAG
ncbi:phosphate ABC transporter substrate-binding protein PstS [Streptomonospora sp. NEAU-YY374]|nr:phosphate ABC transporter substrate-binding protein PstS [Streptomonospora nanhaiensis]MBV2364410.1 phosphate ABC transporter substrate-binding protein PstS [Streptomonospora nanhaiensis]MBX9388446.1 phosphate ABC transporter substrate-binding protein PstS [Streptomonospora nanhaiensis]